MSHWGHASATFTNIRRSSYDFREIHFTSQRAVVKVARRQKAFLNSQTLSTKALALQPHTARAVAISSKTQETGGRGEIAQTSSTTAAALRCETDHFAKERPPRPVQIDCAKPFPHSNSILNNTIRTKPVAYLFFAAECVNAYTITICAPKNIFSRCAKNVRALLRNLTDPPRRC
jgi:hypothetical protein